MKIETESMADIQRVMLMSNGEVFIWHIQNHLDSKVSSNVVGEKIPEGEVGCKICGMTVSLIFEKQRKDYYKNMNERYKEQPFMRRQDRTNKKKVQS